MNHLLPVDWQETKQDETLALPIGNATVHVLATKKKCSAVDGVIFPSFGASIVLDTNTPIILGTGGEHLIVGQSRKAQIVRTCVTELLLRGSALEEVTLWIFVIDEMGDEFFEAARETGLRHFFITNPRVLAGEERTIEIVRPLLHKTLCQVLH